MHNFRRLVTRWNITSRTSSASSTSPVSKCCSDIYEIASRKLDLSTDEGQAEGQRIIKWQAMSVLSARIVVEASEYADVVADMKRKGDPDPYSLDDANFASIFNSFIKRHMAFEEFHAIITECVNDSLRENPWMMKAIRGVPKVLFKAGEEATPASEISLIVDASARASAF